jgi:hypothetical protein
MKYKLNIDTLVIEGYTGTGDIEFTEGDGNTPIDLFKNLYVTKNTRTLADFLILPVKNPKGLPGEIKRILMLLHLSRETQCSTDVVYHKDFKKNSYTNMYQRNMSFKVLLGTKNNEARLKKVIVSNNTIDSFEITEYLERQIKEVVIIKAQITTVNNTLEKIFNKY